MTLLFLVLVSLCWPCATLKFPKVIASNMVLAAEHPKVFGWSSQPSATVIGYTSDTGEEISVKTSATDGFFEMAFKPRAASLVPFSITITDADESIVLTNLLAGDIWVCSGQSNMEFSVAEMSNADEVIQNSQREGLRLFAVQKNGSIAELKDIVESQYPGGWVEASPETVCGAEYGIHNEYCKPHCSMGKHLAEPSMWRPTWGYFSAVCFAHGLELLKATGRPQGLVETAKGGTTIERWSSASVLEQCRSSPSSSSNSKKPAVGNMWAAMVAPLLPLPVRGVVWYQGEGAATDLAVSDVQVHAYANKYKCQLEALIKDWRSRFASVSGGGLTWITVQLAAGGDRSGGALRLAQQAASSLPRAGFAVTTDLYDRNAPCGQVHTRKKSATAKRVALVALNLAYNQSELHWVGPMPKSVVLTSHGVQVDFVGGDGPLRFAAVYGQTAKHALQGFEVTADASLQSGWRAVSANILSTSSVILKTSGAVVGIRYSWGNVPKGEFLYDEAHLPAGPFIARCDPETAVCQLIEGGNVPQLDEQLEPNADERLLFKRPIL